MKTLKILGVAFGLAVSTISEVFAASSVTNQVDCNLIQNLENGKCELTPIQVAAKEKEEVRIRKIVDHLWIPEYYIKYRIDEFLNEIKIQSPKYFVKVLNSLDGKIIKVYGAPAVNLVGVDGNLQNAEGTLNVAVSKLLGVVAHDVPGISPIADSIIVKLQVNGKVESTGAQVGQQRGIVIESTGKVDSIVHTSIGYTVCSAANGTIAIGTAGGCGFESKVTGNFERKMTSNIFIGGNFSESQKENENIPEGNVFFKIQF
jgi:hypothetical protein